MRLTLWLGLLLLAGPAAYAAPPDGGTTNAIRLGIISETGLAREADFLMLELQKQGVALVERDAIGKVLREQSLQAGGLVRDSAMRVGRLLQADGLAFLESDKQTEPASVRIRLVAVDPGAIVWTARFATNAVPGQNPQDWLRDAGARIGSLSPKLRTPRDRVRPISLLRVAAKQGGRQAARIEETLQSLLVLRLVREPALFVLDRENMARLEDERHWAGATADFWTGGHLLDGWIEHDLVTPDKLTVALRLRPAQGAAGQQEVNLRETGSAGDLPALVDRLTKSVCLALDVKTPAVAWNPLQEGREYFRSVRWLVDLQTRKPAVEAAWALGCRELDVAEARLAVMREDADVVSSAPLAIRYKLQDPYHAVYEGKTWLTENPEVLRACADRLLEALTFHRTYVPPSGTRDALGSSWQEETATYLLGDACKYLGRASDSGRMAELRDEIAAVQRECRRLAGDLWQDASYYEWQANTLLRARYFLRSPEEILKIYRAVLNAPPSKRPSAMAHKYSSLRSLLLDRRLIDPAFEPVTETDPARRDALWAAFLDELSASEIPDNVLAVLVVRLAACKTPAEANSVRTKIQEAIWQWRDRMVEHKLGWQYIEPAMPATVKSETENKMVRLKSNINFAFKILLYFTNHRDLGGYDYSQHCLRYLQYFAENKVFSEEQARQLYDAMLARQQRSPKEQVWALKDFINAYPGLLAKSGIPVLRVTRCLQPPAGSAIQFHQNDFVWQDGRLWFYTGRDIVGLDPETGRFEQVALPADIREYKFVSETGAAKPISLPGKSQATVTDSYMALFQCGEDHQLGAIKDGLVGRVSVRQRSGGDWRSQSLAFTVKELTPVGDAIYGLYVVPVSERGGGGQQVGLVKIQPETLEATVLKPSSGSTTPTAQQSPSGLSPLARLRHVANEIWVTDPKGGHWAYNPANPGWRRPQPDDWCRLKWFILTVRGNGPALPSAGWIPTAFQAGGLETEFRPKLLVGNATGNRSGVLRLEFVGSELTYSGQDDYRGRFSYAFPGSGWHGFIPTKTGILIPSNLRGGSLWFAAYDEIAAAVGAEPNARPAKESASTVVP
jgi:hypothetical protein